MIPEIKLNLMKNIAYNCRIVKNGCQKVSTNNILLYKVPHNHLDNSILPQIIDQESN